MHQTPVLSQPHYHCLVKTTRVSSSVGRNASVEPSRSPSISPAYRMLLSIKRISKVVSFKPNKLLNASETDSPSRVADSVVMSACDASPSAAFTTQRGSENLQVTASTAPHPAVYQYAESSMLRVSLTAYHLQPRNHLFFEQTRRQSIDAPGILLTPVFLDAIFAHGFVPWHKIGFSPRSDNGHFRHPAATGGGYQING